MRANCWIARPPLGRRTKERDAYEATHHQRFPSGARAQRGRRGGRALRFRGILRRRRCAACFVGGRAHLPVHGVRDVCGHLGAQRAVLHHLGRHAARARDAERLRSADGGVAGVLRGRAVPAQGVPRPPAAVLLRQLARQAEATGKPVRGGRGGRPARVRPACGRGALGVGRGGLRAGIRARLGGPRQRGRRAPFGFRRAGGRPRASGVGLHVHGSRRHVPRAVGQV